MRLSTFLRATAAAGLMLTAVPAMAQSDGDAMPMGRHMMHRHMMRRHMMHQDMMMMHRDRMMHHRMHMMHHRMMHRRMMNNM